MRQRVRGVLAVAAVSVGSLFVSVPSAAASENPVEVQPCPIGWYGVQVYVQTPSGDKDYIVCVKGGF
jgi:hypothetical protein